MEEKKLTGYPSIDKPWLRWYDDYACNIPECDNTDVITSLKQSSHSRMQNTAIRYFGRKYTFRDLFNRIDTVANAFIKLGVKQGDIVTLSLPNIPENVFCFYALNKLGAIANLIDLRLKGEKLVETINVTKSKWIVATDLFSRELDAVIQSTTIQHVIISSPKNSLPPIIKQLYELKNQKVKMVNTEWIEWEKFIKSGEVHAPYSRVHTISKKDPVCILHTSGTTGTPKGVVLTNEVFLEMAAQIKACGLKYDIGDTFLSQVPPFLAYNIVSATNNPLTMGLEIIMLPDYQPAKFAENIYKHRPNHVIAGPADWSNFIDNPKVLSRNYSFLKSMISGSDKIDAAQKKRINQILSACGCTGTILEGYGMTEIAAAAVLNVPQHNVNGSVGIPLPKVNVCIYDNDNDCELGYGELGEICMAGPTVMSGYYDAQEETENVLRKHKDGILWLHSGDLGYINAEGNIFLKGRLKRVIIGHDGMKVSPFEIEKVLLSHKSVANCCVVGHDDMVNKRGKIAVAYVSLLKETYVDSDTIKGELQKLCDEMLQERYRPKQIYIIESLPLTPNGKVDYRALEKEAAEMQ